MAAKVFFSYSHKDEALRDQLETHLSMLKREGVIEAWHDRRIGAGQEFAGAIDAHVQSADIILLLVSPDFLESDYCYDLEMKRAMERHEAGTAIVIPVILRACDWLNSPLAKLRATPRDGVPVDQHANRDRALHEVTTDVRKAVADVARGADDGQPPPKPTAVARSLSDEAREVLVAANSGSGEVRYSTSGTQSLRVDGRDDDFIKSQRDTGALRRWDRAINQLSEASCIKEDHWNDVTRTVVFTITDFGRDVADIIRKDG